MTIYKTYYKWQRKQEYIVKITYIYIIHRQKLCMYIIVINCNCYQYKFHKL